MAVKIIKKVKFSSLLDPLVSVAEYTLFQEGDMKYAKMIIYNSTKQTISSFKMKIIAYDNNNIKLNTSIFEVNNISLRPGLYLELDQKVNLPFDSVGFNYATIDTINNITNPKENKFLLNDNQIKIGTTTYDKNEKENTFKKTFLKSRSSLFVPLIALLITLLTTIYFDTRVNYIKTSTASNITSSEYAMANRSDFNYDNNNSVITLNKYQGRKSKIYIDPAVFIAYSGQELVIGENCFKDIEIERVVVKGICSIQKSAFENATSLTSFICINYNIYQTSIIGEVTYLGDSAFKGCSNLVTFSCQKYTFNKISSASFKDCKSLRDVIISESVNEISEEAFYGCKNLGKEFIIPSNVNYIGSKAFLDSSINIVKFENSSTRKEDDSFNKNITIVGSSLY